MIRWRTLNKGDNIEEEANAEIQVEHLLELFQSAIKIHQRGERVDAKAKYELILENDVMTEEDTEEQTKGDALHSSSLVLLRFLVFKNYAAIVEDESKLPSCTKDERDTLLTKAMDYYMKALMIDPSERSIWHRIGTIADSLGNLRLARSSFEKGLSADTTDQLHQSSSNTGSTTRHTEEKVAQLMFSNGNISPIQWRCLEGLCDVLYKIGDYDLCNLYMKSGLHRFPNWPFGKFLDNKLNTATTSTNNDNPHLSPPPHDDDIVDTQHDQPIIMHIDTPSWSNLISALLEQYKQTYTKKRGESEQKSNVGNEYLLMNRAVQIHIDSIDNPTTTTTTAATTATATTTTNNKMQDTEMEDEDTSVNQTMEDTTSIQNQQQEQPEPDNLETHDDTSNITINVNAMQIDPVPTTTDTTDATIIPKLEIIDNNSNILHQQNDRQVTDDPPILNSYMTMPQQNDQQVTNEASTLNSSTTMPQQNDQQTTNGPFTLNSSTTMPQQNTDEPSTLNSSTTMPQQNDQQVTSESSTSNLPKLTSQQTDKLTNTKQHVIVDLTMDDDDDDTYGSLKRKCDDQDGNDDPNGTFKRQCNDQVDKDGDDGDDDDDDDEHGHEDKRSSLRVSKRQKEKVESEEIFKKKMMAEENDLSKKAQALFDSFGNMNGLCRGSPWFKPIVLDVEEPILELFWDFFDAKVSELSVNFTWNFEIMKAKDDLISPTYSKKHQFAKFEIAASPSLPSTNCETTDIRQFIDLLNKTNSGTVDSLCQTILVILGRDLEQVGTMDDDTTNLTIDAVETLGQEILNTILLNGSQDLWMQTNDYVEQIQLLTYLSEVLVDRLISVIRTEQSSSSGSTLSSKQRSLVEKQNKLIKQNQERCNFWVTLIGNLFIHDTMNSFSPCFLVDDGNTNELDRWIKKKKLFLRYWLLKGKLALCEDDVDNAIDWYKKCERLFENTNPGDLNMTLGCKYDATVNLPAIKRKMQLMELDKYFAASKSKLDSDDYVGALSQLETLKSKQSRSYQGANTHDTFPMTTMLAKCYMKTERYLDAWECYTGVLISLIQELVFYGGDRMSNNNILPKGDDLEFFKLLCSIDTIVDALVQLLLETNCQDWLPKSLDSRFMDTVMILLRTTIIYTFRHPDFIPLVNNFSNPDATLHAPSKKTKINSYNGVTAKSWVIISILAQHKMRQENSGGNLTSLANLLQNMHDELGEREVCGASKGIFIQHLLKLLSSVAVNDNRRGIYQCYHCLYAVHLVAESELIEEHHAVHGTLDKKAAEHLYSLVIDDVLKKIDRNLTLKNDLKDAIETVSPLFEELPDDNPYILQNHEIIKNYLERPVNIDQNIKAMLQQCDLPIDISHTNSPPLSVVYGHMFFIRGKTLRQHIKNRPKGSSNGTMVDLEEALEQFQYHVVVHPNDHQGWYELGSTLMQLAEEELTWSAVNIITHHDLIIKYQKEAFHCFMKTWQLSSYGYRLKKEQLYGFFTSFGSLIYGMTCAPMDMASFGWTHASKVLDKSGGLHDIQPKKSDPALAYRLSLEFYSHALNYKSPDQSDWRTLLDIGRCFKNLNRPPKEVLGWYVKSIRQCQDSSSTGNLPLDPTYKLCAALLKYLYHGLIEPTDVILYLNQTSFAPNTNQHPPTTTSTAPMPLYHAAEDSSSMTGIVDLTESMDESSSQQGPESIGKMKAFDMIFDTLTEIRKRDKKHVYHRPLYKIAWMHYKIYNDAQKAKTEILQLFTLKQTNKGLLNIWRPEYERPGKHFVFGRQYVIFLIDVAKETNDLETLRNMCRKLRRAGTMLLKEKEGFNLALSAYIEVLQRETLLPHQGSAKRQQIITGPLVKDEFDTACKNLTNELVASTDANRGMMTILQDLVDIRRPAAAYVSTDNLDVAIQECYAILLFERTQVQSLLSQGSMNTSIMTATSTTISSPTTTAATSASSASLTSSPSAIQNMDKDINQPSDSHGTETSMDTSGDVDHTATLATANEPKDQDDGNQTGVEGSVLLLRARALISTIFSHVKS